jgi:tripartite-type tricarboxylate transporter receptor subunit TctC
MTHPTRQPQPGRRATLKFAAATGLAAITGLARAQQAYPVRPIKLVFPLAAGSGGDVIARVVAGAMAPILGQSVVVENKVGAGGVIGADFVAKSPPDGYTLLLGTIGAMVLNPALSSAVPYNVERDFIPVAYLGHTGFVVVTADQPGKPRTLQELIATLKRGGGNFGSPGSGTAIHLAEELFMRRAGAKGTHIPYKGSAQSLLDVSSGEVLFAIETPAAALPLIKGGKLRALAVTSTNRIATLPDVPTAREAGLPDYEATAWWGILAPAGTPPEVVKKLSEAAVRATGEAEVRARFTGLGAEAAPRGGPEFGAIIRKDVPLWGDLIRELGVKAQS